MSVYARWGRIFYWDSHVYPVVDEMWVANVTEVTLNPDTGDGMLRIDKGREDMLPVYVQRTAEGKRPRLRLQLSLEEPGVPSFDVPEITGEAFIVLDLEEFADDPYSVTAQDIPFRWDEVKLRSNRQLRTQR